MRGAVVTVVLLAVLAACGEPSMPDVDATVAADERVSAALPAPDALPTVAPVPSPEPSPEPSPAPSPGPDRSALQARLRGALAALPGGAEVSVGILDGEGRVVHALHGGETLLPASTAKLVAGAAALEVFGPAHRFSTTVDAYGDLGGDGVLSGQLVLTGSGDPALSEEDYRTLVYLARPHSSMEELADEVVAAGIRVVTGGIRAAPDAFGEHPEAPGWKPDYVPGLEARRVHALTVNAGLQMTVESYPPDPVLELLASDHPPTTAVEVFTRMLTERGVTVWPVAASSSDAVSWEVAHVGSPTVAELLQFAFERSDNQTADTLLRSVGSVHEQQTWEGSGEAVAAVLDELGVDTSGLRVVDGSGLSRDDRVSGLQLAAIDQVMRAGPHGATWREALAEAGSEGTLRRRFRGTTAEGRFLGKTGTLDDVTALAGTVEGPDGEPVFHVGLVANVPPGVSRFAALRVFDDVVALLAEDAAGCTRDAPPDDVAEENLVPGLYVTCPS